MGTHSPSLKLWRAGCRALRFRWLQFISIVMIPAMNRCLYLALFGILIPLSIVHAKARYLGKTEMIQSATAIAVVDITSVETSDTQGKSWTYREKATARVEEVLKGSLPKEITLYGNETFICAQCRFEKGKALVFLRKDEDLWVGSNWHLSSLAIRENQVEWFESGENYSKLVKTHFTKVLEEIRKILEKKSEKL
jgi:hypothetical protein